MKNDVLVLCGGLSHERDVSLRSGRRVAEALRSVGHKVVESDFNSDLANQIMSLDDPVVVPMLHGGVGEDGAVASVLRLLDVPRVGSRGSRSRMAFDKAIAVPLARDHGINTPKQIALPHDVFREFGAQTLIDALAEYIGFPMMVKPAKSGSALGASKVTDKAELPQAMVSAFAYGQQNVIEKFIEGTEVAVTVIDTGEGPQALPAVEIRPLSGRYNFEARYTAGETRFITPAELSEESSKLCAQMALDVHELFGLRDISRSDIIVRPDGTPCFLEVNVAPGMTETSLAPLAMQAAGLDVGEVFSKLVNLAAVRHEAGAPFHEAELV